MTGFSLSDTGVLLLAGCNALGAHAPIDDLGLVESEAVILGWLEARSLTDRAVDVVHDAAPAADHVVVVVAHAQLVQRGCARGLDATDDPGVAARAQDVVDRLRRDGAELVAHGVDDHVG